MDQEKRQELFTMLDEIQEEAGKIRHEVTQQRVEDLPEWAEQTSGYIKSRALGVFQALEEGVA